MRNITICLLLFSSCIRLEQNTHLIHKVDDFEIYRVSEPTKEDMIDFCAKGIREIMVLTDSANIDRELAAKYCPDMKVIEIPQKAKIPLTESFLRTFDAWVADAMEQGNKIAFRCHCGCHRTGRLAAYYQMKYQGLTANDANAIMQAHGKYMFLHPYLPGQVQALRDYIDEKPCSTDPSTCVNTDVKDDSKVLDAVL